ncbi:hypothetical protein PR001_g17898 [Phytophthora rubi]|uniref:Uncharacterized protein n=1 Tax=Phytophthora rubi TaxID=129364 RepID=A0A6A3KIY6_9STRA|nr:hypothetical protein PR001_g17898 [Phytophthora rubi]
MDSIEHKTDIVNRGGLQTHCKPLREFISKLIASNDYQGETRQYFTDVQGDLAVIEEECEHNLDRCRSLVDDFNNTRASQQNDVSYISELIAAIFLPAGFLTGMNFLRRRITTGTSSGGPS